MHETFLIKGHAIRFAGAGKDQVIFLFIRTLDLNLNLDAPQKCPVNQIAGVQVGCGNNQLFEWDLNRLARMKA